jgi:hypothetical protein
MSSKVNPVAWARLQAMATELNARTHAKYWVGHSRTRGTLSGYRITPSQDVSDCCEILGSGEDERVKDKLHWFATFYPEIYSGVIEGG